MEVVVLLLWGCFAASGNGDLRKVSGIMKKEAHLRIVQEKLSRQRVLGDVFEFGDRFCVRIDVKNGEGWLNQVRMNILE